MTMDKCSNCGQVLTELNVALALKDIGRLEGMDNDSIKDAVRFFCPTYNGNSGVCQGYDTADATIMAVWSISVTRKGYHEN